MTSISNNGRFQPGQSGNPGGRPRLPDELKARLRDLSDQAVDTLEAALRSDDDRIRVAAAAQILDRAYGKAVTPVDATMRGADLAGEHLKALQERMRKRTAERESGG